MGLFRELIEWMKMFPDLLELEVLGAPQFNVRLHEGRLKVPEFLGVGDPTQQECNLTLAA